MHVFDIVAPALTAVLTTFGVIGLGRRQCAACGEGWTGLHRTNTTIDVSTLGIGTYHLRSGNGSARAVVIMR